jgi:hypothetical protein
VGAAWAAALLVGCSGAAQPAVEAGVSSASSAAVASGGADLPQARMETPSPVELPFTRYYETARQVIRAAEESSAQASNRAYRLEEEAVAACMKEAGFDYVPHEPPDEPQDSDDEDTGLLGGYFLQGDVLSIPVLPDSLDEARRVGYGVLSIAEARGTDQFDAGVDTTGNEEYYESLSDAAKRAYDLALSGLARDDDPAEATQVPGSCTEVAAADFPAPQPPALSVLDPLDGMRRVVLGPGFSIDMEAGTVTRVTEGSEDSVELRPEVLELEGEYAACLKNGEQGDVFAESLQAADTATPESAYSLAVSTAPDGSVLQAGVIYDDNEVPDDQDSLVGSQAERDVAVADFLCREETDYVDRYAKALKAAEEEYLAAHQAEFDAMEAAMERFLADHA